MKKLLILASFLALSTAQAADNFCRHPMADLPADDYHRVKGLLKGFPLAKIESYGKDGKPMMKITFKHDLEGSQLQAVQQRLQRYGGLSCRDAKWYQDRSYGLSYRTADGVIMDCIIVKFDDVQDEHCQYRNK